MNSKSCLAMISFVLFIGKVPEGVESGRFHGSSLRISRFKGSNFHPGPVPTFDLLIPLPTSTPLPSEVEVNEKLLTLQRNLSQVMADVEDLAQKVGIRFEDYDERFRTHGPNEYIGRWKPVETDFDNTIIQLSPRYQQSNLVSNETLRGCGNSRRMEYVRDFPTFSREFSRPERFKSESTGIQTGPGEGFISSGYPMSHLPAQAQQDTEGGLRTSGYSINNLPFLGSREQDLFIPSVNQTFTLIPNYEDFQNYIQASPQFQPYQFQSYQQIAPAQNEPFSQDNRYFECDVYPNKQSHLRQRQVEREGISGNLVVYTRSVRECSPSSNILQVEEFRKSMGNPSEVESLVLGNKHIKLPRDMLAVSKISHSSIEHVPHGGNYRLFFLPYPKI